MLHLPAGQRLAPWQDKLLGAIGNLAATSLLHVSTVTMSRLGELLWACPRRRGKRKQQSPCRAVLPKVHDTVPVSQDEDKDNKARAKVLCRDAMKLVLLDRLLHVASSAESRAARVMSGGCYLGSSSQLRGQDLPGIPYAKQHLLRLPLLMTTMVFVT